MRGTATAGSSAASPSSAVTRVGRADAASLPSGCWAAAWITSTAGSFGFTPASLGLRTDGDQNVSQYVNFRTTTADERILSVSFTNNPAINAFETANFSAGAVPEPAAWAMMIAGFGLVGGALRRQKKLTTSVSFA